MSRVVLPAPVRAKRRRQTRAEAQAVYDYVTERDKTCRAPVINPDSSPCSGREERHHAGISLGMRRVTRPDRIILLCHAHHQGGWASANARLIVDWLARREGPFSPSTEDEQGDQPPSVPDLRGHDDAAGSMSVLPEGSAS